MPLSFVSDPTQLPAAQKKKRPTFQFDFARQPSGRTLIRRQTTEQANRPIPTFERKSVASGGGFLPSPPQGALPKGRHFGLASMPAGFNFQGSQFPFDLRRGISSDASRQRAFRLGFGSGEGRGGFARKAPGQFFDPRFMFDPRFRRFMLQNRLRRRHGL